MGQPVRVQVPPSASDGLHERSWSPSSFPFLQTRFRHADHSHWGLLRRRELSWRHERVHVVLVDDNLEILSTIGDLLEASGYRVTPCNTGLSALLRIGLEPPDVVILDLKLDDISGFDVYRTLKAAPETASLPVLFMSGVFLDQELLRNRVNDPNVRLLLKPVPEEELLAEIESARSLERRHPRAA